MVDFLDLQDFFKDIWSMIKENITVITLLTVAMTVVISFGLYAVSQVTTSEEEQDTFKQTEEEIVQIGSIDVFADEDYENITLSPSLPSDMIEELQSWKQFSGDFSVTLNGNSELDFSNNAINPEYGYNPIESFLGLERAKRSGYFYDEETGEFYYTVRVNPDTGSMAVVNSHYGVSDYLVDLDITDETEDSRVQNNIDEEADSILDVSFGMDPNGDRLMRFETFYNWQYGVNFPRSYSNERNFYVLKPQTYNVSLSDVNAENISTVNQIKIILAVFFVSLFASVFIIFLKNIISSKLNYSFSYGWSNEDLHLKYNSKDTDKQVAFDMLQSSFYDIAIITEHSLSSGIIDEIERNDTKNVTVANDISDLPVDKKIEEFVLVIQKKVTDRDWYQKQRKHLKAYKDISVKIIEI